MKNRYEDRLVGHRGQMATHPENTLIGYRTVIDAGAKYIECDIQLTRDKVPVVLHDHGLSRTAGSGSEKTIFDLTCEQAQGISVHYPTKFEQRFYPEYIATLAEFLKLLGQHPEVLAMVELKQESIDHFDLDTFIQAVFPLLERYRSQVIVISFNADVVRMSKAAGFASGWVIESMNEQSQATAMELLPPYLITDVLEVDVEAPELWSAPPGHQWQWMLYDVTDPLEAKALMDKGVDLIETANISALMSFFSSE